MPTQQSEPQNQPLRTLEFGLYPTRAQELQLEAWLELQRHIWNYGVELLRELDAFSHYDRVSKARVACCPLPWDLVAIHPEMDKGRPPEKWFLFGAQPVAGEK